MTVAAGENGGRADVRWGSIQDKNGVGVTAVADSRHLQMSVTQYASQCCSDGLHKSTKQALHGFCILVSTLP